MGYGGQSGLLGAHPQAQLGTAGHGALAHPRRVGRGRRQGPWEEGMWQGPRGQGRVAGCARAGAGGRVRGGKGSRQGPREDARGRRQGKGRQGKGRRQVRERREGRDRL
jgi:hypothetical protein